MALTQSARLPGPSWDEEVVPALRKRLENESRTLARRMSAISMASMADDNPLNAFNSNLAVDAASVSGLQHNDYSKKNGLSSIQNASSSGNGYLVRPGYQYRQTTAQADSAASTSTPGASTSVHPRVNGIRKPSATTSFHRSRTFSQPYATPNIKGGIRQPRRTNTTNLGDHNLGSRSPRLVDAKPTRIPKVSRGPSGSTTNASSPAMPSLNGTSPGVSHSATPTPVQTPNPNHNYTTDIKAYHFPTSHSAQGISQHTTARLMNEPAPFNIASSSSSIYNIQETDELGYNAPRPSRDSVDSMEERPFEHWYRGEISRNGGVGELRVGRRQEMLDIANYGHAMHNKRKLLASRQAALLALEDARRASFRKRAESVAGLGLLGPSLRERGSLYLEDDAILDEIERVLDEDPLTDLDGEEGSDIASISTKGHQDRRPYRYSNHDTDFIPGVGDITVTTAVTVDSSPSSPRSPLAPREVEEPVVETPKQQFTTPAQPPLPTQSTSFTTPIQPPAQPDASIITPPQSPPTPATSPPPRSKSRQSGSSSRIPTYERRSSESRTSTPSQHSSNTTKVGHPAHVIDLSISPTPSPSPPLPSATSTTGPAARTGAVPSTPTSATKRGASPGPHNTPGSAVKKPRTPVSTTPAKTKPKPKPTIKRPVKEEDIRRSVAQYPTPGGEGENADMSDAIPYWTQPKIVGGDGNWDDVVLPVVARKKGLDNHYEKADGSPQPKRKQAPPVAPAPGTFGYDGTKARRKDEDIEMGEFGQPQSATNNTPDVLEEVEPSQFLEEPPIPEGEKEAPKTEVSVAHDNIRVPIKSPPSPAPFSHYAPTTTKHLTQPISTGGVRNEQQIAVEQNEKGAGCCKCVVM